MKEKLKRRHNWKSRQVCEVEEDDSATKKIKLELPGVDRERYDSSNALVLPSKKRKTKIKPDTSTANSVKKLSKKQEKKLKKVLEVKKKKRNRAELFEALSKLQATTEETKLYLSTSDMQTKGFKRNSSTTLPSTVDGLKSVKGSRKGLILTPDLDSASSSDLDTSDESSDSDSNDDTAEKQSTDEKQTNEPSVVQTTELDKPQNDCQTVSSEATESLAESDNSKVIVSSPIQDRKSAKFRPVNRTDEIQECRLRLPILAEEQGVMEAINENPVVIICGETGSGKTTQVPQFLYEAGYTGDGLMIGVTEPRRVAAITMSQRIALEMNLSTDIVSYQIRYEGNVTSKTEIKFMTDGVLLKEMQNDFLLMKYSVIIVDEAHERSVFTDILIGLLSRIVPLRIKKGSPLKLVIMSATLKVEDFTGNRYLFKNIPAVVKVESRQYPVSVHFNKKTAEDYINEAYHKTCKIHRQLPEGGILIFVTGQREVNILCNKLRRMFPIIRTEETPSEHDLTEVEKDEQLVSDPSSTTKMTKEESTQKPIETQETIHQRINLDEYSVAPMEETNEENDEDCDSELGELYSDDDDMNDHIQSKSNPEPPMYVLPLYSFLPTNKQAAVFQPPPEGCRLCVIATNVAETSITIPNIKYVIDTGKVKVRLYDKVTGVSTFRIMWASKASANQRAGRAGRIGPGHCYRLYSSAVFNDEFVNFSQPEICRRPIDDVVLQLKEMNIDKVLNFPFPTPVDSESISASEKRLVLLGALEKPRFIKKKVDAELITTITPLGHAIARFPVAPRYGKMLALSNQHGLLPYVVAITAALSVPEMLHESRTSAQTDEEKEMTLNNGKRWMDIRRTWAGQGNSLKLGDVMVLLKAVGACEYVGCSQIYCEKHGLHYKSMIEIRKLRLQLTNAINLAIPSADLCIDPKMMPPTELQAKLIRQIMLAGLPDNIAKKVSESEVTGDEEAKRKWKKSYKSSYLEEPIFLHPTSVLFQEMPEFVVYQELFETNKIYMKGVTSIEPEWLFAFCANQCSFSNPLVEPEPRFDQITGTVKCYVTATFGKCGWELPATEVDYPEGLERMRWFARFLLNGDVFPKLARFVNKLLSPPATMTKSWAKLQSRTDTLLKGLQVKNVYSKETLNKEWGENKNYLFHEYTAWLPESSHNELHNLWPPM